MYIRTKVGCNMHIRRYIHTYVCAHNYTNENTLASVHTHTQHVYVLSILRRMYVCMHVQMGVTHTQTCTHTCMDGCIVHKYNYATHIMQCFRHISPQPTALYARTRRHTHPAQVPDTRNALHITQSALHITQSHPTYVRTYIRTWDVTVACLSWQTSPLAPISAT